jgi:Putative Flp pilus-assembly TadE/G-like
MNARDDRGQAAVLTIIFLTVLLGVTAFALDVGSWYRAKRQLQATADAAALAGAQALPESTDDARAWAIQYADKNGGVLAASDVTFSRGTVDNDTISVRMTAPAPGFFSKIFGLDSVTVGANAAARSDNVGQALGVAPIVVNHLKPELQCTPLPCSNDTSIQLDNLHNPGSPDAAGSFGLIDLIKGDNGNAGASEVGSWIQNGFDEYMDPGNYDAVPSSMFNSVNVRQAMNISVGQVLLFPVYDSLTQSGSNAKYHIIGWVGFYISSFDPSGSSGRVYGHFTRRVSGGIQVTSGSQVPDYGARAVQLVN